MSRRRLSGQALAATLGSALVLGTTAAAADSQQISADPFVNPSGQHETAVEPDSLSVGRTVVAVFQLGRIFGGGASGIGWATSVDGGRSWRNGVLPGLTVHQTLAGPHSAVSDPTIAYDHAHGVWIASALALRDTPRDTLSSVVVSRSFDGVSWSGPLVVAPEQDRFAHDKNWNVCDTHPESPHFGNCYTAWTTRPGSAGVLALSVSTDGGLTWSSPTVVDAASGSGWQPLVRADGTLVIVYEGAREIAAIRSSDGGRSFGSPTHVGDLRVARVAGMRAPSLPSAELDSTGRIYVAWHDCSFRSGCAGSAPNDIVFTSSADGARWNRVRRVRTRPELDGLTHFVPGLAVDATTNGSATRLAVTFYVLTPRNCAASTCMVAPMLVSSSNAGRTWSAPEPLAASQPIDAYPASTSGRFLGDYISTSFVDGGAVVPVFAAATAPADGAFHQGVFGRRVEPLADRGTLLRLAPARVVPLAPRAGERVVVTVGVTGASPGTTVSCSVLGARVQMRRLTARFSGSRATCVWLVRSARAGSRVQGGVQVLTPEEDGARNFSFHVGTR